MLASRRGNPRAITFATMFHGARILVAPLDWGLGHSTRCIPLIRHLLDRGATPIIGADSGPLELLSKEFPELEFVRIPGVNIRYAAGHSQLWSMARQFPAMVRSVQAERALFDRLRHDLRLHAVISDQRFGIRSRDLPSVLITHQVFPFTPVAQTALRKLNRMQIMRFDRCWIMDGPVAPGLAGGLSHGPGLPSNARYIGTLSRMGTTANPPERPHRVVAVISGPEPQRTLLEQRLVEQLQAITGEHLLVRGLPAVNERDRIGNVQRVPHLDAKALEQAMCGAELIVSRSGYTTLMDLVAIGRSALLIPTPGQAEQEYLGRLHTGTGRFLVQAQDRIDLAEALLMKVPRTVGEVSSSGTLLEEALADLAGLLR